MNQYINVNKTTFVRRISAVSNAIQTIDNEANHLIIYCLNCIRHGRNATYEPDLKYFDFSRNATVVVRGLFYYYFFSVLFALSDKFKSPK